MFLMIHTYDEGSLDTQFRDGDIFQVHDDDWIPGDNETKRFLVIQMPDHPGDMHELVASEYAPGLGEEPQIRRMRKYRVPYELTLDADEVALVRDREQSFGPVTGRFQIADIIRK